VLESLFLFTLYSIFFALAVAVGRAKSRPVTQKGHFPNFMKKTFFTLAASALLALGMPSLASAQNSAVTNAILNQRTGLLDKARTDIDKAIVNEKTSGKGKTWFTRGEIYQAMMESPIYGKQLQPGEGLQKAYESYAKAIELDTPTGEFGKQAVTRMDNLYGQAFNAAVTSYNAKDFDKAIENYKLASRIKPQDTTAVLYSAYASEAKQDFEGAKAGYNKLLGMNYKSVNLYMRLLQMAKQQKTTPKRPGFLSRRWRPTQTTRPSCWKILTCRWPAARARMR
jgi:tetratricopeptide (TPR) repeat protein